MKTQPFQISIGLIASALICVAMLSPREGLQAQTTGTSVKDITVPANKTELHFTLRGGAGLGSGGAVLKDGNLEGGAMYYGGGGGGYSGGGDSKSDNGGGSWANINFVSNAKATSNGVTGDPLDGYVTYKFQ